MAITKERKLELQKEQLQILVKHGEPKFTPTFFPYTSGQIGPYFFQSIVVTKDGEDYRSAIEAMVELITGTLTAQEFDAISGGESRDWDFSNPVAYDMARPHTKLYGSKKPLGYEIENSRFVHVADLNNEGSSMRDKWAPQIAGGGGKLVHAFFYVDRMEDGVKELEKLKIPNDSVVPLDAAAWQFLLDQGKVSRELYDSLCMRLDDKTEWAHNQLRNNIGHLVKLLSDPNSRAKAEKVLITGYPDIKEELDTRMQEDAGYKHQYGGN